jgi:type III secretion protein HrpB1
MSTAPAMHPSHTVLAFRTPPGAVSIPAGQSKQLGVVEVAAYERIRIVADERAGSGSGVQLRVTITEGNELVAQLDVLHLTPNSQITRVYEVPCTKLTIFADASGGAGSDGVDVLVYGYRD